MDKEKAIIYNMTSWYCIILTRKVENLNAMEPDRTFGLDYNLVNSQTQSDVKKAAMNLGDVKTLLAHTAHTMEESPRAFNCRLAGKLIPECHKITQDVHWGDKENY